MANAAEKIFSLNYSPVNRYIEIANAPANTRLFDIANPSTVFRIGTTATSTVNAVLPGGRTNKILAVSNYMVPAVRPVHFRQIHPEDHNYIIISHPLLRQPAS